jgi:hypothetical protein
MSIYVVLSGQGGTTGVEASTMNEQHYINHDRTDSGTIIKTSYRLPVNLAAVIIAQYTVDVIVLLPTTVQYNGLAVSVPSKQLVRSLQMCAERSERDRAKRYPEVTFEVEFANRDGKAYINPWVTLKGGTL